MQTLHRLRRFRDLRAISPGQSPSRWRTPSMRESTSTWEALFALPNPPEPTSAVGSPAVPQPGARGVAPRWRWSRLPGAGAERMPQQAQASMGQAPRQARRVCAAGPTLMLAANHGTAPREGRDRQGRSSRIVPIPSAGPSFRPGRQHHGVRCRSGKTGPLAAGDAMPAEALAVAFPREAAWPATTSR